MKKIRILTITFDTEIKGYEIPAFRGAIIEKVGQENVLFHNHLSGDAFLYKYPLIQYKQLYRKPSIVCIDQGVDEIHKFFENRDWNIKISDRWLNMKIDKLQMNQFTMQVWDKKFRYRIMNWIALNQKNFKEYQVMESMVDKLKYLEKILTSNILSFAKGIEWTVEKTIELSLINLDNSRMVTLKKNKVLAFDVTFSSNVFLPNNIGLGKSTSLGFGLVRQLKVKGVVS